MKKILLTFTAIAAALTINAQVDTLTSHFNGDPTLYAVSAGGFVGGNNDYGDIVKLQLFDAAYGVTSGGNITGVLLGVATKTDNGGSFVVAIWGNNAGEPANPSAPLATAMVTLASVDTSAAGFSIVDGTRFYNVVATLSAPIPANNSFWAGVVLPTGTNAMSLFTSNATTNPFADALTHTGELWNTGAFYTFGDPMNWDLETALAIYPIVSLTNGINENVISTSVYPNPTNNILNIVSSEEVANVSVVTMDGKVVANSTSTKVDVANLVSGVYIYQVNTAAGNVSRGTFMKN